MRSALVIPGFTLCLSLACLACNAAESGEAPPSPGAEAAPEDARDAVTKSVEEFTAYDPAKKYWMSTSYVDTRGGNPIAADMMFYRAYNTCKIQADQFHNQWKYFRFEPQGNGEVQVLYIHQDERKMKAIWFGEEQDTVYTKMGPLTVGSVLSQGASEACDKTPRPVGDRHNLRLYHTGDGRTFYIRSADGTKGMKIENLTQEAIDAILGHPGKPGVTGGLWVRTCPPGDPAEVKWFIDEAEGLVSGDFWLAAD